MQAPNSNKGNIMEEKIGIKELKEAVIGTNEVALFTAERMSDGADFGDFKAFYDKLTKDEEFQKVLKEAWEGRQKIPKEVQDIDLAEGMELAQLQISYLPRYIKVFSKKSEDTNENAK